MDAHLLRRSRDPRLPARVADPFGLRPHIRFGHEVTTAVGRRRPALAIDPSRGTTIARCRSSPAPARSPTRRCRTCPGSTLPRQDLPLGPLGPRLRPDRQARRRDRHRRLRDPVRAGDPAAGRPPAPCSSAPRRGSCRASTAAQRCERWLYRTCRRQRLLRARHLLGARELVIGFQAPARMRGRSSGSRSATSPAPGHGSGAAGASSPPTTASAASGSCSPTTTTRRSASPTWMWSPPAIREVRARPIVDRRRHGARQVDAIIFGTGFHVTDMPIAERVRGRDGRRSPRPGRAARRRTGARPSRASPTSSSCRPEHRPGAQLDRPHDRLHKQYRQARPRASVGRRRRTAPAGAPPRAAQHPDAPARGHAPTRPGFSRRPSPNRHREDLQAIALGLEERDQLLELGVREGHAHAVQPRRARPGRSRRAGSAA